MNLDLPFDPSLVGIDPSMPFQLVPLRAVVFDYDCFATGAAVSDIRNVLYSLRGDAHTLFLQQIGPLDPQEMRIDRILCTIEAIVIAAQRSHFPAWAQPSLAEIQNGSFALDLKKALA